MTNGKKKTTKKKSITKRTNAPKKAKPTPVPFKQIINYVQDQMASDDDGNDKQSIRIQVAYQEADTATKGIIDDIFTSLCGWSMKTIIENADHIEEEDDEEDN